MHTQQTRWLALQHGCQQLMSSSQLMYAARMSRRKVSTTIYITEEQNELLKRLSELTRVPVAEYIRQGIDHILAQHRQLINPDRQLDFEHLLMARKP